MTKIRRLNKRALLAASILLFHLGKCIGHQHFHLRGDNEQSVNDEYDFDRPGSNSAKPRSAAEAIVAEQSSNGGAVNDHYRGQIPHHQQARHLRKNIFDKRPKYKRPVRVNKYISSVATVYAGAHQKKRLKISVPPEAKVGDILLFLVGGSASGKALPDVPSPSSGLKEIGAVGRNDINLRAYYKKVTAAASSTGRRRARGRRQEYTISGGKNTYACITVLRGVDARNPVHKYDGLRNSMDGREGEAVAPSVGTVPKGVVIAVHLYDDPHVSSITNDRYYTMLASFRDGDDGMAVGIGSSDGSKSGPIYAVGEGERRGGGHDVTMSISLTPELR